ncbi:MAG: LysR family transcriptional regulator, partial [Proteobacteria bacterium]
MTELDSIPVFVKVAQMGSFTQAARVLGMPNTTVSAKVAQLERSLGITLMQRTTRKLHLTEAGQTYLERCVRALAELEAAESEITSNNGEIRGVLRITSSVDIGHSLLPRLVDRFLDSNPSAEVDLIVTNRMVDLVGEGVDVAIRAGRLKDSSLIAKKFMDSQFGLYASKSYLKEHGTPTIKTLEKFPFIKFTPFKNEPVEIANGSQKMMINLKGPVQVDDLGAVRAMALLGRGIAILPDFVAETDVDNSDLIQVVPEWVMTSGFFSLVYPPQRFVSPKVRAFIDSAE